MFASSLLAAEHVLTWLAHAAWQAGLLAIVVLSVTWLWGQRLQPRWRFALWLIVFARLASPVLPEASWSVFRLASVAGAPQAAAVADAISTPPPPVALGQTDPRPDNAGGPEFTAQADRQSSDEPAGSPARGSVDALSAQAGIRWLTQLAVLIWIAGVVVLGQRRLASVLQLRRQQRHWQAITDPDVLSVLRKCCGELRISRSVSLYTTPDHLGPATCGVVRPRIVLPQSLIDHLSRQELRLVLLHELVHVRRHDVLVDQLTGFVTILHWFHPVAWISRHFLRSERELACDAAVLAQSPTENAAEYGLVILKTIESLAAPFAPSPGLVGMFSRRRPSLMHRRIRLIAAHRPSTWPGALMGGVLIVALTLVGLTDAQTNRQPAAAAQKPDAAPAQEPAAATPAGKDAAVEDDGAESFPITVFGRALDAERKPIAGAEIFLASPRNTDHALATTKTDAEGNYRFEKVMLPAERAPAARAQPVGSFEIFGRAKGFGFSWRPLKWFYPLADRPNNRVVDPAADLPDLFGRKDPIEFDLHFGPPATLRGRIVDDLGEPLVDARVVIRRGQPVDDEHGQRNLESLNEKAVVPEAIKTRRTDKKGRFEFRDLPENCKFWIEIRAKGHSPRTVWASTAPGFEQDASGGRVYVDAFELVFPRPRQVKLRIIYGDTEQPAVKVGVGGGADVLGFWETTDDDGTAVVPLPDGEYQLSISPRYGSAYLNTKADFVVSAATVQQPILAKLRPAAVVDITVVDADTHEPLAGADVWTTEAIAGQAQPYRHVHGYRSWEVETRISHYETPRSGKDGKMRVLFEPGEHHIGVGLETYPPGYKPAEPNGKIINCQAGAPTAVEFALRKQPAAGQPAGDAGAPQLRHHPLSVTGKAVDENGKPIAGATIVLVATNGSPPKLLGQTTTDGDGRYEFRGADLPYYAPQKADRYEEGTFQVFGRAPGVGFAWHGMRSLFIDPRFIDKNGKSTIISPSYGYFPGEAIDLDLAFLPARPIRGRFVDDQGQPIPGVNVYLTNCDYLDTTGKEANQGFRELRDAAKQVRQALPDQLKCVSDADGRFELKSVPEGIVCRLAMEHPEYGSWALYTATADSPPKQYDGSEVHSLPIEMTRRKTRSVSVEVHYADTRQPAVGALVGAYVQIGTNNAWGETDQQGKVTLKLPAGEYTLWSNPPKGADYLKAESELFVRPTDEAQSVALNFDPACVLVLKALDATTGAGVEGVTFWYDRPSHSGEKRSVQSSDTTNDYPATNAKGELRILVPPGTRRYGIGFNPLPDNYKADEGDKMTGRELTLNPGQKVVAEFQIKK